MATGSDLEEVELDAPGRECVIDAFNRITASKRFRNSERICEFLRYVVYEALEGRGALVKARTIAADVFGRQNLDEDSGDAIVRTSAHRLRMLLEGYYHVEGAGDPYRILLPKGSYVPSFYRTVSRGPRGPFSPAGEVARFPGADVLPPINWPRIQNGGPSIAETKGLQIWLHIMKRAKVSAVLLSCIFALLFYWEQPVESGKDASVSVVVTQTSPALPDRLSFDVRRRLVSNLVAFEKARIVDQAHSDDGAGGNSMFTLEASVIESDGLMVDWTLVDSTSGAVVGTGHERLDSGAYASVDRATARMADRVLGVGGALLKWSDAGKAGDKGSWCRMISLPKPLASMGVSS